MGSLFFSFYRFLLNKMASNGEVELMTNIGSYLTAKVKKEVSFDNRLCNAYLSAGQGKQFLQLLDKEVDEVMAAGDKADPEQRQALKDKFPR